MADKDSFYDSYFIDDEGRRKAGEQLGRKSKNLLDKYDPELVEIVRKRKEAGESLKQIYKDLDENPDVLDIGMQLAVLRQSEDIRGGE
jgi:hypothetical protein